MTKIAFFQLAEWEREHLLKASGRLDDLGVEIASTEEKLTPALLDRMPADFDIISVFVDSPVTKEIIARLPQLKLVTTRSTGYDHIDMAAAAERQIKVATVPAYGADTVAEYTFGLMIALARKIFPSVDRIKESGSFSLAGLRGFDLQGKTLGIIGTGRIGKNVARIARGFEMRVLAYDPYPDTAAAAELNYQYADLDTLLRSSDVVTLHAPSTADNHHLINANRLALVKPTAILINTARGSLVDTTALVNTLHSGNLGGAALDVLEEEGVIKDELGFLTAGRGPEADLKTVLANHVLIDMPNVIITPHNAFNSAEALARIMETTLDNIRGWLLKQPVNLVTG